MVGTGVQHVGRGPMCEMSVQATRGCCFKCMGSGWLRDLLWWLWRWRRAGRNLESSG